MLDVSLSANRWLLLAAAALAAGCTGAIGDAGEGTSGPTTGADRGNTTPPPAGTATPPFAFPPATPGAPPPVFGGTPAAGAPGVGDPMKAGPRPLRRLTNHEYDNTIRDLLGDTSSPAAVFPVDRDEDFLFPRAGDVAVQDAKVLRTAAESVAVAASTAAKLAAILPCDPVAAGEAACLRQFHEGFVTRAFRRPLRPDEIARLDTLFSAAKATLKLDFAGAIGFLVEAILQSPNFLYHWEVPAGPTVREGGVVRLSHFETASRLSYFLWASMPDRELFAAAAAGRLGTAAEVEAQARRMLADPRGKDTVTLFFESWLGVHELGDRPKSAAAYPEYAPALVEAMHDEIGAFARHVVFDGDGRFSTVLGASFSFVNQALAGVYGVQGVKGTPLQKTNLDPAQRAGVLTQPAFLAATGSADGSNPSRRGKAVVTGLLCREIPPPPANVPPPKSSSTGGTTRARFEEHATNDCARGCHALIDPIGFAFENYDGIGKYRTMDNNLPVDASGSILIDGASRRFVGAVELGKVLADSAEARGCFSAQWMRYALGREITPADGYSLQTAAGAFSRPDAAVRDLLVAIATSRSFRYRTPAAGEVLP